MAIINSNILNKNFTTQIRGIAILTIIAVHLYQFLIWIPNTDKTLVYFTGFLGQMAVAIFLFLSGYGNYISIRKNTSVTWLLNKSSRLYFPIVILIILQWLFLYDFKFNALIFNYIHIIRDVLQLGFSGILWYLKVQLLAYVILFIIEKINKKNDIFILFLFWIAYMFFINYTFDVSARWWFTVLSFPFGCLIAKYKDLYISRLENNSTLKIYIFALLFLFCGFLISYIMKNINFVYVFTSLFLCFILSQLSCFINFYSKILDICGKISLELYTTHAVFINYLRNSILNTQLLLYQKITLFIFITIILSIFLYKLSKFIYKK